MRVLIEILYRADQPHSQFHAHEVKVQKVDDEYYSSSSLQRFVIVSHEHVDHE